MLSLTEKIFQKKEKKCAKLLTDNEKSCIFVAEMMREKSLKPNQPKARKKPESDQ